MLQLLALPLLCVALSACARPAGPAARTPPRSAHPAAPFAFESTLERDHPLVGAMLGADGQRVTFDALVTDLTRATIVSLGEKHDNPDHHRLQAHIYDALAAHWEAPALAAEMVDASSQPTVEEWMAKPDRTAEGLAQALAWSESGWPDFSLYAPVFEAVVRTGGPVVGGGLPRGAAMPIARGDDTAAWPGLPEGVPARFRLTAPLPAAAQAAAREEMQAGHCGMLPEGMLDGMVRVQRARDALLAEAVRQGVERTGHAVLIAGGGHLHADRAVPHLLRHLGLTNQRTVLIREVDTDRRTPGDYVENGADYVLLTPRANDTDHCAELRKHFHKR